MIKTSDFFEHLSYLYCRCDNKGEIEHANQHAMMLSGKSLEEIVGSQIESLFHPDDREEIRAKISENKTSEQFVHRFKQASGSYRWYQWQFITTPEFDGFCFMGEDISEQKRIASALTAIEEVTNTGYWEIDLETGILFWSDKIHEIHETDKTSFKPRIEDGLNFYPPESVDLLTKALGELEKTGKPYDLDLAFNTAKNNRLIVNAHGFSETRNGRVVRSYGTFTDLTKIKEEESKRQALEERVVLALEAAKIGVWDYDFTQDKLIWDERMFEIFGVSTDSFAGKFEDWQKSLHPDDLEAAENSLMQAVENHSNFNETFRVVTPKGEIKYVLGMASITYTKNGEAFKATGVNIDLSESERNKIALKAAMEKAQANSVLAKKMAEKAKAADQQKSAFLANMSHEVRTPISGLHGLINIVDELNDADSVDQNKVKKYLEMAKSTSSHLIRIVGDILDFSKIEAGKLRIQQSTFNLKSLLMDLLDTFRFQANERSLYFEYDLDNVNDDLLVGDEFRLKQILYNLLSNAVKFTPKGGIKVSASLSHAASNQVVFTCKVYDTGCGIEKHKLHKLFSPFEQVDNSSTRQAQGTGLGLSISNELALLMGGQLSLESTYQKGSVFTLQLPFSFEEIEQENAHENAGKFFQSNQSLLEDLQILVVEDNEINAVIVTNMLEMLGIEFKVAKDGIEAIEVLSKEAPTTFDLILMDCQMPRMDGYETTKAIRTSEALTSISDIPIIALTANAMVGDKEKCLDAGMDEYIAKPIDREILLEKMSALLSVAANRSEHCDK